MTPSRLPAGVIRVVAALILDENDRMLLVRKRGTVTFMQPGGKVEPGELLDDALARELREELGLLVDPARLDHLGRFVSEAANESDHLVEAEVYFLRSSAAVRPAAEIEELAWIELSNPEGMRLAPLTTDHLMAIAEGRRALRGRHG